MSIFFEIQEPKIKGKSAGYVRAGLESDDNANPELSFWLQSNNAQDLRIGLEAIQRYTRWLDSRNLLRLSGSAERPVKGTVD